MRRSLTMTYMTLLALALLAQGSLCSEDARNAKEICDALLVNPTKSDLSVLRGPHSDEAIKRLWLDATGHNPNTGEWRGEQDGNCWIVLMRLGHRPSIEHFEKVFRSVVDNPQVPGTPPTRVMVLSAQPLFIPVLMEGLHKGNSVEVIEIEDGDIRAAAYAPALFGPSQALEIVKASGEFRTETRDWASSMLKILHSNPAAFHSAVQSWWKVTEPLVLRGEYAKVLPLGVNAESDGDATRPHSGESAEMPTPEGGETAGSWVNYASGSTVVAMFGLLFTIWYRARNRR